MERMKTQVELLKECCDIKDAACVKYQKRIAELEEENKKLKEEIENHKQNIMQDELEIIPKLEEENKNLKAELETATKCSSQEEGKLRNLEKENKKLKEKVETLELWLDNKEKLNEEYRKKIDELKFREDIADIVPEGEGHIAEETIQDLQARIKELSEENGQLKENEKYRHHRCMKAERQVQHSLGGDDEECLYD